MTLRMKMLVITSAALAALIAALFFTSKLVLHTGFARIEHQDTIQNAVRASNALLREVSSLDTKVHDWSAWDDTYRYVKDRNSAYHESNLVRDTFTTLNINFMIFIDNSGEIVFSKGFDLSDDREILVPKSLFDLIERRDKLSLHTDIQGATAGVLTLPEYIIMVSSRPILTTSEQGPIRGTLIFVRIIDDKEIRTLSDITRLPLEIMTVDDPVLPSDFAAALSDIRKTGAETARILTGTHIAGYSLIPDIYGKPALVLRVTLPRDIQHQESRSVWSLMMVSIVTGIIFLIIALVFLEYSLLRRLAALSGTIVGIGKDGDFSARLPVNGKDELTAVAEAGNRMLDTLQDSMDRVTRRNREMRTIMDSAPIGLLSLDREYRVNPEYSRSAEEIFGLADLSGHNWFELLDSALGDFERETLRDYLDLLYEESLPDEDMARLNPFRELEIKRLTDNNPQWVRITYILMHRGDEQMSSILVEIENITEEKQLAEQVAKTEAETAQIITVMEDTDLYNEFLADADKTIGRLSETVLKLEHHTDDDDAIDELFRDAHTLKGTGSAFGADGLSSLAERLESVLNRMRDAGSLSGADRDEATGILDLLASELTAVRGRAIKIMGEEAREYNDIMLRIPLRQLKSILESARRIPIEGPAETLRRLRMLRTVPARKGFARAFRIANDLLRRTEKLAEIRLEGAEEPIDCEIARDLNIPLIHLFRNAFSHGIEEPAERIAEGKPGRGTVTVFVRLADNHLVIEFSDDGRGLDPDHLRKAAVEKHHITPEEAAALSAAECRMLIFRPGFTTATSITSISGRGVGLDTVLASVKKLGGSIEIASDTTVGVKYIITVPSSGDE